MKKGVELSLNTVIIAAIAMLVLVVVSLVFTGNFGKVLDSLIGVREKVIGKADCVIIGADQSRDSDGDGYDDKLTYKVIYRNDQGDESTVVCQCDIDEGNPSKHLDDSDELHTKYC
jgi:hypothetical protein